MKQKLDGKFVERSMIWVPRYLAHDLVGWPRAWKCFSKLLGLETCWSFERGDLRVVVPD